MADSLYDLSDEELTALSPEELAKLTAEAGNETATSEKTSQATDDKPASEETAETQTPAAAQEDASEVADHEQQPEKQANPAADGTETGKAGDAEKSKEQAKAQQEAKPVSPEANPVPATGLNYEAEYKRLLAPFKANGREMQVQNVDEAIQLMQMGANYNRKMEGIKPHLATVRMLSNAGISNEQLNFLIDVHRKDPAAINKLVKESGIDPLDLSPDKAGDYKPGNHQPHEAEVALDAVLTDLDGRAGLARTMDIVANRWDASSKQTIAQHPGLIALFTQHVEEGIYDKVWAQVERERTFGRLVGVPDLQAYQQVGDAMEARGEFAAKGTGQPQSAQRTAAAPAVITPDLKEQEDSNRNDKRRAAAPAKSTTGTGSKKEVSLDDIASMSDEDFLQFKPKFS